MSTFLNKILQRIGQPDLVRILSQELSGTEFNSLLLEVLNERVAAITPAQLLNQYQLNRFVKPCDLPVIDLRRIELDHLILYEKFGFEPLELSPVSALGSCAAVATVNQKKIISALRGTEVLADATNAIALHIADLKKNRQSSTSQNEIRFSAIQRHVRAPMMEVKGFTPHFKIGCLVTAGYDSGNYSFEKENLFEHITLIEAIREYYRVEEVRYRFLCRKSGYENAAGLAQQIKAHILKYRPHLKIDVIEDPEKEINYYRGIQYKADFTLNGKVYEIADGGFVDWTQQLLQNKKERMLTTGMGFEFMYRIVNGKL
ncbi:MAG: hypothetical protein ACOYXT_04595 [Bacteroidota bacterium]